MNKTTAWALGLGALGLGALWYFSRGKQQDLLVPCPKNPKKAYNPNVKYDKDPCASAKTTIIAGEPDIIPPYDPRPVYNPQEIPGIEDWA